MTKKLFIIFVLCISSCATAFAQNQKINIGQKHSIYSNILEEERPYWVHLPQNYNKHNKYPVLYLLDGNYHFHYVTGIIEYLSSAMRIPEMIVIALPNTNRYRDLTPTNSLIDSNGDEIPDWQESGGAQNFLRFLESELAPKIENDFSTASYRLLVGHSLGGLFTIFSFLENPELFQSYISIDPALYWDDNLLIKQLKDQSNKVHENAKAIYISSANNENSGPDTKVMLDAQNQFTELASKMASNQFKVTHEYFKDEDHFTVPIISVTQGLLYIFDVYEPSVQKARENPAYVIEHYRNISEKLGYQIPPRENVVNFVAYNLLRQDKKEEALKYFKLNIQNFPYSSNAYDKIADAYKALANDEMTISSYEKAIKLAPQSETLKQKLLDFIKSKEKD